MSGDWGGQLEMGGQRVEPLMMAAVVSELEQQESTFLLEGDRKPRGKMARSVRSMLGSLPLHFHWSWGMVGGGGD